MSETEKVRWGILGATSRIASGSLIPAIQQCEQARLVAVASRTLTSAQEIAAGVGPGVQAYGDYDSLIADHTVEAIYLPLPNNLHVGWAVEALNNGKHVLCEQPLALNAVEAAEMVITAADNDVILSEAFMYYYHPLQQQVAHAIKTGLIGDVRLVRASFSFVQTDPDDYRRSPGMGGGALLALGCYGVHIARHAFGQEPGIVSGNSTLDPNTQIDMTTTAQLEFDNGGVALIDCSFALTFRASYEIVGTLGSITVPQFYAKPEETTEYMLTRNNAIAETRQIPPSNMYIEEICAMSQRIRSEESTLLPAEDGLHNMLILDAIAASARSGQKVPIQ